MKTYYKLLACLLILGFSMLNLTTVNAQCTNSASFGSAVAPTGAGVTTISTCSFQSEYSTISSVIAGNRYVVTASIAGTYITMHFSTPSGSVVAAGVTPLQFTAPCAGTYYAHWNTNSSCGLASSCMTTTIACSSCGAAASQCTNSAAFATVTAPVSGVTTITTCSFQSEYSTVNGVAANTVYSTTAALAGTFITVHSGSSAGPVVASGITPIIWTSTVAGSYYLHWNTNTSCGLASSCMTTTIGFVGPNPCGPPPSGCTNSAAFGSGTIPSNNTVITLTTCAFAGEYSTVFGAIAGQTLQFTATASYSPVYLTVHSGTFNGPVVASGNSPLTFANTFTGTLFVHYNTNSSCGTLSVCHTGTVQCTSCAPPAAPNDLCSGAITISCGGTVTGNTTGAGTDATTCNAFASPGLWYQITPPTSTSITLALCGSSYDTWISVYSACGGTCIIQNDDFCGLQSTVTFAAIGGTNYKILVNGFSSNSGAFTMTATCAAAFDPCAAITASNTCGNNNTTVIASGTGVWTNGPFLPPGKEAVYTFTPVTTGNYTITQNTSTVGTWVDYFFKPQSSGCNSTGWTFIQDLNGNGLTTAGFPMTAGVPYYIYLDPEGTAGGTVNWRVNCSVPAPPNDDCSAAPLLPLAPGSPLTFTGNTVGATSSTDGSFTAFPTVWHAFTLAACADVTISFCATSPAFGDTWINLATACPAFSFVNATSWAQSCPGGGSNWVVQYTALPAGNYWVPILGSEPGFVTPGPYSVTATAVACPPPATNDDCSGAIPIACGSITTGNTNGSNPDVTPCGTFAHGLWYSITLPTSGTVYLSLCGSTYDTWISIFDGTSCGSLGTCIASNDDAAAGPCAFTLQSYIATAPLPAGTYYILVAGFSTNMGSFSLDASCSLCAVPPNAGTISGPASGCTGSMVTYNVTGSSSTQWQVSTTSASGPFTDIAGETSPTLNYVPGAPGTYYFQNSASGPGCTPSFSNVITTSILSSGGVLTTSATPSASACPGTTINLNGNFATGAATLTITISAPGFEDEVEWTVNPGGFSGGPYGFGTTNTVTIAPSSYPVTFSINSQGTFNDNTPSYTVTCNATSTVLVSGSLSGGQTFTSGPLNCVGSSGVLTSPSWSGPGGFSANTLVASLPVTPTSGGVYTLTGISPTGCQVSSSVTVTTLASPVPSASSNAPVCDGSSLSFFGDNLAIGQSSGNTYSWSGPNGYSASGQFPTLSGASLLASGTYTVTVTNSLGCTESSTTSVSINPNPVLSVASVTNASCIGSSDGCIDIDANNGTPLYLYDLGGNSTLDGIYCGLAAGTYTVTVIDDNGCESLTNASVIEEDLVDPVIICTPDVTVNNTPNLCSGVATWVGPVGTDNCAGATTSQTGGPVSGSTFPVGITPITYTVTDAFLNTATCTFNVIVVDNQNPSITCPPDVIVNNDPGFCYATAAALGNPTTGDNCAVLGVSNNAPAQFPVGATIVDWEVEDLSGNKAQCQQFVIVQDNENPVISGMPSNITFTASPADCFPSISWTAPTAADNCSIASFTSTSSPGDEFPEGTTTVTYTALDINGNSVSSSFTVTILTQPLVVAATATAYQCGFNISCNGGSNGQASSAVTGGCLPYSYVWSTGSTNANVSGLTAGTYTVTVTDDNGHVTVQSVTLTQPPVLSTTLGPDQSYEFACTCANLVPATTGGSTCSPYSYAWSTGVFTSTITVCPTQTATFTVTVTDINGCTSTDVISIIKPALVGQLDRYVVLGVGTQNDNIGSNGVFNSGAAGHRLATGSITLSNNGNINTWIAGNNVIIGNNSTVGTLYRNTASIGNNAVIGTTITPVTLPLTSKVPCFPTFSGGANVNVPGGATVTISPGTYNNITTGNNSILRMNAGVYNVNSISTGNGGAILPNGAGVTAKDIIVFVKTTMTTGNQGNIHGNFYSQGLMSLGNGNNTTGTYQGSFLGKPVITGNNLNFHLDAYCYSTLALCNVKLIGEDASEIASGVFNLYPNPSNGEFTLQYSGTTGNVVDITIVNTMGQVVYQRKVYEFNGVMEQSFDLGNLGSGIYTLQIHNGNELSNKQFVVTH